MARLFALFGIELLTFFFATLNFRFCAKGHILRTLATDVVIAGNGFFVIKLVSSPAGSPFDLLAYMAGAGLGSVTAMLLTRGLKDAA